MTQMIRKATHRAPRHLAANEVSLQPQHLLVVALAALLMTAIIVAGIGTAFALARKSASVNYDGKIETLYSWGNTVEDLLKENHISIDDKDKVHPGVADALQNGMQIKILSSREITVDLDGQEAIADTTEPNVAAAVKANWPDQPVLFKSTSGEDRHGNKLPLFAPGDQVQLAHDGTIDHINAKKDEAVEDIVKRAKLELNEKDILKVVFTPTDAPLIQVQRVSEEQVVLKETIPFDTETTEDDSKYKDEKTVTQKGADGEKEIVKIVRTVDGQVESETVKSEKVLAEPVTQKVTVGTKTRPVSEEPAAAIAVGDDVWSKLAFCESGGRPNTNTGNGFYGMYQFTLPTWRAVGGTGLPSEASAEEQTKRAKILQARSGWGQWPACTRKLGLR